MIKILVSTDHNFTGQMLTKLKNGEYLTLDIINGVLQNEELYAQIQEIGLNDDFLLAYEETANKAKAKAITPTAEEVVAEESHQPIEVEEVIEVEAPVKKSKNK